MSRLALFDCDGTLVDSQANICLAMEQCFDGRALPLPDRHAIRRIVGLSLVEAVATLLPEADDGLHRAMAGEYKLAFQRLRGSGGLLPEPMFDGIGDALAALQDDDWLLGIATGKSDRGLGFVLAHHGIAGRFVTLQTADRHPSKPHPAMIAAAMAQAGSLPATTVMIGDTSYDMAMAVAAGAHPLGVGWGYHTPDELTTAGAVHILSRPVDLAPHFARVY